MKGTITNNFIPYLFEYYKKVHPNPIVNKYLEFSKTFIMFLQTPIMNGNNLINPVDQLMTKLPKIFEVLDKLYEEEEKPL